MTSERWTTSNKAVYNMGYHLIGCPKYRRQGLVNAVAERLKELLREKAANTGVHIETRAVMSDHVHLFVKVPPTLPPHDIVQQFKGFSSPRLRPACPKLKSRWPTLWTRSYDGESVGHLSPEPMHCYIEDQKNQ
jgi:putative transposase